MKPYRTAIILLALFLIALFSWKENIKPRDIPNKSSPISIIQPNKLAPKPPSKNLTVIKPPSAYELWLASEDKEKIPNKRFYKVNANGDILPETASYWSCVYDSHSGLMWEVKTKDGSWQDRDHTYSWFEPKENSTIAYALDNSESDDLAPEVGIPNKGTCYEISCDTYSYRQIMNEKWICSSPDWRLPYAHELGLLDHSSNYYPDIDTLFFPNTVSGYYWSRSEPPKIVTLAWAVDFHNGFPYITEKRIPSYVRMVTEAPWLADEARRLAY
jgi:hypothetical protein